MNGLDFWLAFGAFIFLNGGNILRALNKSERAAFIARIVGFIGLLCIACFALLRLHKLGA